MPFALYLSVSFHFASCVCVTYLKITLKVSVMLEHLRKEVSNAFKVSKDSTTF